MERKDEKVTSFVEKKWKAMHAKEMAMVK